MRISRSDPLFSGGTRKSSVNLELMLGQPEKNLIRAFITELTGTSLQSTAQLHQWRPAWAAGTTGTSKTAINDLHSTFEIRNMIAHEMDVNFSGAGIGEAQPDIQGRGSLVGLALPVPGGCSRGRLVLWRSNRCSLAGGSHAVHASLRSLARPLRPDSAPATLA